MGLYIDFQRTAFLCIYLMQCHIYALSQSYSVPSSVRDYESLNKLNSIVGHIQNPDLYNSGWADGLDIEDGRNDSDVQVPTARRDLFAGEVITLHPIQSISYDRHHNSGFDITVEVDLLEEERYPYPCIRYSSTRQGNVSCLFIHSDDVQHIGWYGNIVPSSRSLEANCVIVPLAGAAPICALVATRDIGMGEALIRQSVRSSNEIIRACAQDVAKRYANEIGELISYLDMACGTTSSTERGLAQIQKQRYHSINKCYPNLRKINCDPDIFEIDNFLSEDECERMIKKVAHNMQPCLVKNEETGNVEPDPSRTSSNANIPRNEIPSVTKKILQLANCEEEQMEILQVLHYKNGQEFRAHTDGFQGPTSACGFLQSGRIMTLFCYLNDVKEGKGGTTLFPQIDLEITPKRGLAIIHFPTSLDLVEDRRTEHQGSIAIDDKWILTSWIWKNFRADTRYAEETLLPMSEDII